MYTFIVIFVFIVLAMVIGAVGREIYCSYSDDMYMDTKAHDDARIQAQLTLAAMRMRDMYMQDMMDDTTITTHAHH